MNVYLSLSSNCSSVLTIYFAINFLKRAAFFLLKKREVPIYLKGHNILIKKKIQIMSHSFTSELPILTPPLQEEKKKIKKITMQQLSTS